MRETIPWSRTLSVLDVQYHRDFPSGYHTSRNVTLHTTQDRSGSQNAGWKSLIANHSSCSSNYYRSTEGMETSDGHYSASVQVDYHDGKGPFTYQVQSDGCFAAVDNPSGGYPYIPVLSLHSRLRLNVALLNRVRAVNEKFNGGTFFGEFHQVLDQIRSPAQALRTGLSDYLKAVSNRSKGLKKIRNPRSRGRAFAKIAGGTWLEHKFGWVPLISDIEDAGAEYTDFLDKNKYLAERVSVVAHDAYPFKRLDNYFISSSSIYQYGVAVEGIETISGRMYAIVKRDIPSPYNFVKGMGLGFDNFLPTVWELIPYSFLVDYFLNIGSCLSAVCTPVTDILVLGLTTKGDYEYKYSSVLNRDFVKGQFIFPGVVPGSYNLESVSESSITHSGFGMIRETLDPLFDLPVIPTFEWPLQSTRWMNVAALLTQSLGVSRSVMK